MIHHILLPLEERGRVLKPLNRSVNAILAREEAFHLGGSDSIDNVHLLGDVGGGEGGYDGVYAGEDLDEGAVGVVRLDDGSAVEICVAGRGAAEDGDGKVGFEEGSDEVWAEVASTLFE
jgi:hypothetical protein